MIYNPSLRYLAIIIPTKGGKDKSRAGEGGAEGFDACMASRDRVVLYRVVSYRIDYRL